MFPRPSLITRFYHAIGKTAVFGALAYGGYQVIIDRDKRKRLGEGVQHVVDNPDQAAKDAHEAAKRGIRHARKKLDAVIDDAQKPPPPNSGGWGSSFFGGWFGNSPDSSGRSSDKRNRPGGP